MDILRALYYLAVFLLGKGKTMNENCITSKRDCLQCELSCTVLIQDRIDIIDRAIIVLIGFRDGFRMYGEEYREVQKVILDTDQSRRVLEKLYYQEQGKGK
jgi:hypothetical protein